MNISRQSLPSPHVLRRRASWFALGVLVAISTCAGQPVVTVDKAQAQIDAFWNQKIAHCNGSEWYIGYNNGQIQEIIDAHWDLQLIQVTSADWANGIRFHGTTQLTGTRNRMFMPRAGGWKPWEDGMGQFVGGLGIFSVDVQNANGRWNFKPSGVGPLDSVITLTCDRIPKEGQPLPPLASATPEAAGPGSAPKAARSRPDPLHAARAKYPAAKLFLVRHDHNGRSPIVGKNAGVWAYCEGALIILPDKIIFEPTISKDGKMDGFLQPRAAVSDVKLNVWPIQNQRSFHLKFSGLTFNFVGVTAEAPTIVEAFN